MVKVPPVGVPVKVLVSLAQIGVLVVVLVVSTTVSTVIVRVCGIEVPQVLFAVTLSVPLLPGVKVTLLVVLLAVPVPL